MANYADFTVTSDTALDAINTAKANQSTPAAAPTVQAGGRKVQVDTHGDGRTITKDLSTRSVDTQRPLRPGHVLVGGVETTIEAARAAGLIPPGFDGPVGGQSAAPAGNYQAQQQPEDKGTDDAPKGAPDATDTAAFVMDTLAAHLGADVVETGIWQAAETGDYEGSVPPGVTTEAMDALVEGYTAQANAVLRSLPAGVASVGMLEETMNEAELRQARMATIYNDREKLAHIGRTALGRMETMPYQNPQGFEALIADMPEAERKALSFNDERREWMVKLPGKPAMSFGTAVRAGIVRVG